MLRKLKRLSTGYDAEHWDIKRVTFNGNGTVFLELGLWKDKAAKQNGDDPVLSISHRWSSDEHSIPIGSLKNAVKNLVKNLDDFSDAIDE